MPHCELCCFDRFCMLSTRQQGRLPLSFYSPRDLPPKRSRTSSVLLPSFSGMMYEHLLYMTRLPFILFKLFCSVFTCFRSTPIYLKNTWSGTSLSCHVGYLDFDSWFSLWYHATTAMEIVCFVSIDFCVFLVPLIQTYVVYCNDGWLPAEIIFVLPL